MPTARTAALSNSRIRIEVKEGPPSSSEFITPVSPNVLGPMDGVSLVGSMPEVRDCILDGLVLKLNHQLEWTPRRLALTKLSLCFASEGEESMRDNIVLHEVTFVSKRDHVPGLTDGNATKTTWNQNSAWYSINEKDSQIYAFEVQTVENGYNSGRSYYFRAQTQELRNKWVTTVGDAVTAAKLRVQQENSSRLKLARIRCKEFYDSSKLQGFVACLIFGNFVANIAQSEVQPPSGSYAIFGLELCINLFANWFWPFVSDGWSCFDFFVVVVSLISTGVNNVPGVSVLRLMRAFRVLRLFGRLRSLRQIINALTAAIVPVCNAFLIMGLVTCLYAILGVNFYSNRDFDDFGSFFRSLFTMFQVCTGDNWADIARGLFPEADIVDPGIVGWTLLQVVVAVLIDNFTSAADEEKNKAMQEKAEKQGKNVAVSALDPLLAALAHFNTSEDLSDRITTLFKVLDSDESQSLSYEELAAGLRKFKIKPTIYLSREDFDLISSQRSLCNDQGDLTPATFEQMMREQLKLFVQRQMAHAMGRTDESDPSGTVLFVLKLLTVTINEIASPKGDLNGLADDQHRHDEPAANGSRIPNGSGPTKMTASPYRQEGRTVPAEDPLAGGTTLGASDISETVRLLEEQTAQLQSNVDAQNGILQEILYRLPQVRQTLWIHQHNNASTQIASPRSLTARRPGVTSNDTSEASSTPPGPKGPKFWLGSVEKERPVQNDRDFSLGASLLSSRLMSPSGDLSLPGPVLTPRLRVIRTPRSQQKATPRPLQTPVATAREKEAAGDSSAKVPKSSLAPEEQNHATPENIKWDGGGGQVSEVELSANKADKQAEIQQVANGAVPVSPVAEELTPANAAGRLWSEFEKAVIALGKTPKPPEPESLQPREISTAPVHMLAALFSPVKAAAPPDGLRPQESNR